MKDRLALVPHSGFDAKFICPACRNPVRLPYSNGNTIVIPLTCGHCGRRFRPRFYCPDQKAPEYHIFEAEALYVDNLDGLYTFCPEHTFTTYDLVELVPRSDGALSQFRAWLRESLSSLLFQLALALESTRQRLFPRSR